MAKKRDYLTDIKPKIIQLGYDLISLDDEYTNTHGNLKFKCVCCGNVFERMVKKVLSGSLPFCKGCIQKEHTSKLCSKAHFDSEKFDQLMKKLNIQYKIVGNGYAELSCSKCNDIIRRKFYLFNKMKFPNLCEFCAKSENNSTGKLTKEIVNKRLMKLGSETVCIQEGNFKQKDIVSFKCSCGDVFTRKPNTVISQQMWRCSKCSNKISKPELIIMKYLEKNNINYEYQKRFDDCRNVFKLPFDFYIESYNCIIEYDGEFHYFDKFGELENRKYNDKLKTDYCKANNIKLLRIPYFEFNNIDSILDDFFVHGNIVPSQSEMIERCND